MVVVSSNLEREDLGAGPVLDEYFDFRVDTRGDTETDDGVPELGKDLSYRLHPLQEEFLGTLPNENTETAIERVAETAINSSERVQAIRDIRVDHQGTSITVEADVVTALGDFTFVEEVSE